MLNRLSPTNQIELARSRALQVAADKSSIAVIDDPVDWIQTYFYVPELKGPLKLFPYQQAVLREALRVDESGNFVYSTIVWSDIKKSIKSTVAAAVGLYRAFQIPWGNIIMIANDLKQADSRVGFYMRRAIELNPTMRAMAKVRNYSIELPNRASLVSVAIDPTGEAGSNADMVIFSELWGAHQEAQNRMWTEMTLPPAKFGKSFRWVETYAGFSGESLRLENLYEQGVKEGEHIGAEIGFPDLELYRNGRLLVLWNTRPRLPWQTNAYYEHEETLLTPSEFQRVHRNQWSSSTEMFVPAEWWHACAGELPPLLPTTPMVFAVDAGVSSDNFAIVGVSRQNGLVIPRYARKWVPPKRGRLNFAEPEAEIRRLAKQYNVVQWAYDMYQTHDMMTRLRTDGIGWVKDFSQQEQRAIADKHLYDIIRERRLRFAPALTDLTEHVLNANKALDTKDDRKLRLIKRAKHLKIDLAVALSMAAYEAGRLRLE